MRKFLLIGLLLITYLPLFSQSQVSGFVRGLRPHDSAIVRIQRSSQSFFFQKVYSNSSGADAPFQFNNLPNGRYALGIDARGYTFPTSLVLNILNANIGNIIFQVTPTSDTNFVYQWQDDSSYVGHAQQTYINESVTINVLGIAEPVPSDFNSVNILNEYGYLLSNDSTIWTNEDTYRIYQMFKKLNFPKYGERDSVNVRGKIFMSIRAIDRDVDFYTQSGVHFITISRAAFTYATPQVVTLNGIKGKYFSKRLYNAVVYYYTNRGNNYSRIDEIATSRYGLQFLNPSQFLQTLMNETSTNFQQFTSDEKLIILSMFEEFPDAMQRQAQLKYLVRRINGQPNPFYPNAAAIAWVGNQTIEWMEGAFSSQSIDDMQRLVLHEKAHFLWAHTFSQLIKNEWITIGGWFEDPTSSSGWSTTKTTEFVSAYAHANNPDEDMAESIAFYITNPDALRSRSLSKFEFIRDRIMKGTVYLAIINPGMTFTVYNLYPDYNYPGKINRTKVEVLGAPNEDKIIKLEIELTTLNNAFNAASWASCRFTSSIGTFFGMGLSPIDSSGKILRGQVTISKYAKSGYWTVAQITVADQVGNQRLENNTTYGLKCFVNSPLEDIDAPLYIQNTLQLDSTSGKFIDWSGRTAAQICGPCADTIPTIPAMKVTFKMIERNTINPYGRAYATVYFPTFDTISSTNIQPYSQGIQINGDGIQNDFTDSIKTASFYFPVPYYAPRGYYLIPSLEMTDLAFNTRMVLLDLDTNNQTYFIPPSYKNQRALRDSVYFHTPYPDLKPPKLDLNDIEIRATPTNVLSPNGETLFEMWVWVKDTTDFPGYESGFFFIYFTLRDPQGLETTVPGQINYNFNVQPDSTAYGWHRYRFSYLLPPGSPPGIWGVSSIIIQDRARNKKYYSFVEFVRFDVEGSSILQRDPYLNLVGGAVNSNNAPTATFNIGCDSCVGQYYRLKVYSSMGGAVPIFTGQLSADTIQLANLNLIGVIDGNLHATLFISDSTEALIGLKRRTYIKDTQKPIATITRTSTNGRSNIYNITTNENVTNSTIAFTDVIINGGVLLNVARITQRNFRLEVDRNCRDTISVALRGGSLADLADNRNDSVSNSVVDRIAPSAAMLINTAAQCLTGNSFSFTNTSTITSGTLTHLWSFGDGGTASTLNATRTYGAAGTYSVKLVSTSNNGCKDSTTQDVRVDPSPTATLSVAPFRSIHPGLLTTISATVTPSGTYKYTWYRNTQLVPTEATAIVDSIGYRLWSGEYKMTVENLSPLLSCASTTADLIVGDSASAKFFIYPNPNNGQFRVTYYSPTNTRYKVVVMDMKGAVLYRQLHDVTNRYQLIDIKLLGASRGMYIVQIQDLGGVKLATGKLVIL